MQDTIRIGDGLLLEAHPDGPYILLRREGEPDAVRIILNEVRHLADAMCPMAAEIAEPQCVTRRSLTTRTLFDRPDRLLRAKWMECLTGRFRQHRRLVTRCEKRAANYRAMWVIAATIHWLQFADSPQSIPERPLRYLLPLSVRSITFLRVKRKVDHRLSCTSCRGWLGLKTV